MADTSTPSRDAIGIRSSNTSSLVPQYVSESCRSSVELGRLLVMMQDDTGVVVKGATPHICVFENSRWNSIIDRLIGFVEGGDE